MDNPTYPSAGAPIERKRHKLAPKPLETFDAFSASVCAGDALPGKTKPADSLAT